MGGFGHTKLFYDRGNLMAVIVPHPSDFADTFQSLLDMGVPVNQIATTSDTEYLGLVVSDDVYERWTESTKDETPTPKRRGRPPKNPAPESSPVDEETSP